MSSTLVASQSAVGQTAAAASPSLRAEIARHRDRLLLPSVAGLLGLAWIIGRIGGYTPGSDVGYWLGLVGGVAMLVVLLYPLRKRVRFLHSWGATKHWFFVHMTCGIGGPLLVLAHSRFEVGSINATVALTCMLLVAASGIIGRFIYIRIHHGLYGRQASLREVEAQLGLSSREMDSRLAFAPRVEKWLKDYEAAALAPRKGVLARCGLFFMVGAHAFVLRLRCRHEIVKLFRGQAKARGWSEASYRRLLAATMHMVDGYLYQVQRVAQFHAYERLFSLWHVLHTPLVWLLVLSGIAHVVAVHAY